MALILAKPTEGEWEAVVRGCPWATFFHTPVWMKVLTDTFPEIGDETFAFELEDGTKGVFPLSVHRRGLGGILKQRHSLYPGVYGGPLACREIRGEEYRELCQAIPGGLSCLRIGVLGTPGYDPGPPASGFRAVGISTRMLNLAPGFEAVERGFSKGHRSGAKKAAREGVTVRSAEVLEEFEAYYRVYEETQCRWTKATSSYPMGLFRNVCALPLEQARLWVAEKDRKVVAGALVFSWKGRAAWWHGACKTEFLKSGANLLLQAQIIRWCCEEGYRTYDFNPSGGHRGVEKFKASFGAEKVSVPYWVKEPSLAARWMRRWRG